jgi:tRNA (adenine37-N6)-methyltransferase
MFTPQAVGFVRSPYTDTKAIPKGLGVKHNAEGVLEILPEFEAGLQDIDGFSHLFVIWEFDRSKEFELVGTSPADGQVHGVFATRSPRRPNPIGLTVVELLGREGRMLRVRGLDMKPYMSTIPLEKLRRGWLADAEA